MAGFFSNLFNRKKDNTKSEESFFLDPDSSKTVGDMEYMRKTATVRRTFPKTKTGGGADLTIEISSSAKRTIEEGQEAQPKTETFTPKATEPTITPRRTAKDSNMDMFRNMAKDMRKP